MTMSRKPSFRPQLDALEDRLTPSVSWSVTANSLDITGTDFADNAVLIDDGSSLTLDADGPGPNAAVAVPNKPIVNVSLRAGNDTFLYQHRMAQGNFAFDRTVNMNGGDGKDDILVNNVKNGLLGSRADFDGGTHLFSIDGGNDNDEVIIDLARSNLAHGHASRVIASGDIIDRAVVSFDVQGGFGSDFLQAGSFFITSNVEGGSSLSISLKGDPPSRFHDLAPRDFFDDFLSANYQGQAAGSVSLYLDGGPNNDLVQAIVIALAGSGSASSTSGITVFMSGGEGDLIGFPGGDQVLYGQFDTTGSADHVQATLTGETLTGGSTTDFDVLLIQTDGGLTPVGLHNGQISTLDQAFDQVIYL
jgi:hypothetical protein